MKTNDDVLYRIAIDQHAIVSITDVKGNILHVNDLMCTTSGYRREELLGKNHRILKSDEHSPELFSSLWREIARGRVWHGEIKNKKKSGAFYWVRTSIVPILNESGKPYRYIGIRTDITDRKNAEEKLQHSKSMLKHALLAKTNFMSRMNHEIRTPLNGILGLSEVLKDTELDDEQSEMLLAIVESSEQLTHLLENLLNIENVSKFAKPNPVEVSQTDIRISLNQKWQAKAAAAGLKFEVGFGAELPEVLYFDFEVVARVVNELVRNAFAFTKQGRIGVHIRLGSGNTVVTEVSDTGCGIHKDDIGEIFEPFMQVDTSISRQSDGAGLGLAVCRELVEGFGGTLDAHSQPKLGSVFSMRLPIQVP